MTGRLRNLGGNRRVRRRDRRVRATGRFGAARKINLRWGRGSAATSWDSRRRPEAQWFSISIAGNFGLAMGGPGEIYGSLDEGQSPPRRQPSEARHHVIVR